jgi:branched-chain amino acid transport system ATP-binding protein
MIALEVKGIVKRFGGVTALNKVSFSLEGGKTLGLVGGNGSGKTTLLNVITKMVVPNAGEVYFKGERIDTLPAYKIARLGIGRIFQTGGIFKNMTVLENLLVATDVAEEEKAEKILSEVGLLEKKDAKAATLSGGQQRLLEFGRAMIRNDELILLDEPFAGVSEENSKKIEAVIKKLNGSGKTLILIEHDPERIKRLCNQIIELHKGETVGNYSVRK